MAAFASSFALVFVSELGDKSMLLAIALVGRYRASVVLLALTIAEGGLLALAVVAGGAVDAVLPRSAIAVAAAFLFLAFGVWAWIRAGEVEAAEALSTRSGATWATLLALTGAFALAEMGDKTQLAVLSLSGLNPASRVAVWLGGTLGFVLVDGAAVLLGDRLRRLAAPSTIARVSAAVFVLFGLLTLVFAAEG